LGTVEGEGGWKVGAHEKRGSARTSQPARQQTQLRACAPCGGACCPPLLGLEKRTTSPLFKPQRLSYVRSGHSNQKWVGCPLPSRKYLGDTRPLFARVTCTSTISLLGSDERLHPSNGRRSQVGGADAPWSPREGLARRMGILLCSRISARVDVPYDVT
jgi:hypothetical protein